MSCLTLTRTALTAGLLMTISSLGACGGTDDPSFAGDAGYVNATPGGPGGLGGGVDSSVAPNPTAGGLGALGGAGGMVGGVKDAAVPAADSGKPGPTAGGLPCAVQKIVKDKCQLCHGDPIAFGAPMPLVTDAQFLANGKSDMTKKVHQLVKTRVNSTVTAVHMPPSTSPQLSAAELTTLNAWLDQGAPASTETCTATPAGDAGVGMTEPNKTGLDCYKFLAHAKGDKNKPYPVGVASDQYLAFGFKAPWTGTVYGETFTPVIGNPQAIHHWLLYEEPNTDGDISTTIGQHAQGKLLAGWAPGGQSYDFRKYGDVGFELPGSTYTLEIHYNSSSAANTDASGVEVCVQKNKPANVAGMSWVGYDELISPSTTWTGVCDPGASQPIHILFVTPHLHQSGTHIKSIINGTGGARTLIDQPFDFNYQITYEKEETLMPGESITTTCTFNKPQTFGQATDAEMCYLFTYSYPKGLLTDNGIWGGIAHGEGACLGQ